jgi:hemoglobin-like flavoprotein
VGEENRRTSIQMNPAQESVQAVSESYARVRGTDFAQQFYDRFLRADEEVRRRFAETDFARQRELFLHGVFALIDYSRGRVTGELAVRRLAKMHGPSGLDIPLRLYDLWVQTLLETLREQDPEWSPELGGAWRAVLQPGVDVLRRA